MTTSLETSANTLRTHPSRHCSTKTPIDFSVEHVFTCSFEAVIHSKMSVPQAVFRNEIPIQACHYWPCCLHWRCNSLQTRMNEKRSWQRRLHQNVILLKDILQECFLVRTGKDILLDLTNHQYQTISVADNNLLGDAWVSCCETSSGSEGFLVEQCQTSWTNSVLFFLFGHFTP